MNLCQTHNLSVHIAAASHPGSPDSKLLDGSITSIYDTEAVTLRPAVLQDCAQLASATFTELTTLTGGNEFNGCAALESFSAPKLASITGSSTFSGCTSLTIATFPRLTTWSSPSGSFTELVFGTSGSVGSLKFPNSVKRITADNTGGVIPCYNKGNLEYYSGTSATATSYYTTVSGAPGSFAGCSRLLEVHLDNVVTVAESSFRGCSSLPILILPSCKTVAQSAFESCVNLGTLQLGSSGHAVTSIGSKALLNVPTSLNGQPVSITISTVDGQPLATNSPWGWAGNPATDINWQQA